MKLDLWSIALCQVPARIYHHSPGQQFHADTWSALETATIDRLCPSIDRHDCGTSRCLVPFFNGRATNSKELWIPSDRVVRSIIKIKPRPWFHRWQRKWSLKFPTISFARNREVNRSNALKKTFDLSRLRCVNTSPSKYFLTGSG